MCGMTSRPARDLACEREIASSPEELALELSQAVLASQSQTEIQLREKAAAVLGASSIVVPVAALAVGKAPAAARPPIRIGSRWILLVRSGVRRRTPAERNPDRV